MITQLANFPDSVLAFRCTGRVTRADYDKVLVPAVLRRLKGKEKVRIYYETGADFDGLDPGAMWEDFKVGVEHITRWDRIAIVTDVDWIKKAAAFFSFLMPVTVKLFPLSGAEQARAWISA